MLESAAVKQRQITLLDQELIPHCYSFHLVVAVLLLVVVGDPFKKAKGSVISNHSGMKFGMIVLH